MTHYPRWFHAIFLLTEILQALIGIATLTLYRPCLTMYVAQWFNRYRLRRQSAAEFGK